MTIRVLLADDQAMVRAGFGAIIRAQRDMSVVGEASNGAEAVDWALRLRPDVILMDVRMPVLDGIQATRQIVARTPECKLLVLTTFDRDEYVWDSLAAGASGFLLKDADAGELLRSVRAVYAGDAVLAPSAARRLVERLRPVTAPSRVVGKITRQLEMLSEREREVIAKVASGLTNREIAASLSLAESTVKTHLNRILAKLEIRDRVGLVIFAYDAGLASPHRFSDEESSRRGRASQAQPVSGD